MGLHSHLLGRKALEDEPRETVVAATTATSPPPPSFPLLKLHPELIICVFKVLPPVDAIALSLCSKFLFSFGPSPAERENLDYSERPDLLTRLERDLVDTHVYCPECMKLESETALALREDGEFSECSDVLRRRFCHFDFPHAKGWWHGGPSLGYHILRFVMNQYTLRSKLGDITLDVFRGDQERAGAAEEDPSVWNTSLDARIIDGELYIQATHTIEIPVEVDQRLHSRSISDYMKSHRICIHSIAACVYDGQYNRAAGHAQPADLYFPTTFSCGQCLSDFTYDGRLDSQGVNHIFQIKGYHLLGSFLKDMTCPSWKFECFVPGGRHPRTLGGRLW
ncbi:hypothetical protein B0T11DRAFT_330965 [Plectosphaerella cucumerina]|uniref:F-box domain-containing protein n=1 Tax=Plectosphaerella cucumerina TaxID=40658 RepID=A0A8K0X2H3_9PEZI|nr:hypothetical protein B0T11DRAFT_330965 [Plectosphaerella cucumerina]